MSDDVAIRVDGVSKTFKLPHEKNSSIKGALINFARHKRGYEKQQVLDSVSFEIKRGEFFGIVGRNGSGKSTLLKLLAGIYTPDSGGIQVNGKLTPFIELGVGFNPELTGRENVFLNGALLGFSRKEMLAMYDEIVEFAELERFMDQKLKNYSSGMQVRLAFSIAIRANTDILVLDEVLAVGDAAFQQKCNDYFEKLKENNKTIILVTHDMNAVKSFCSRALLIEDGEIKLEGSPDAVANQYTLDNYNPSHLSFKQSHELSPFVKALDVTAVSEKRLANTDKFEFDVTYELTNDLPVYLGIGIKYQNVPIMEHNSLDQKLPHTKNTRHTVRYSLPLKSFSEAKLALDVAIFKEEGRQLIGYKTDACEFFVTTSTENKGGAVLTNGTWKVTK